MLSGPEDVRAVLQGTLLAGCPVTPLGDCLLVGDVAGLDVLEAWRAARAVLPGTRRWPVAVSDPEWNIRADGPADVESFVRLVDGAEPWRTFPDRSSSPYDGIVDEDEVRAHALSLPSVELRRRMADELRPPLPRAEYERWLYDVLRADDHLRGAVLPGDEPGTGRWFRPSDYVVVLLPTDRPWLSPAWLSYDGALDPERQVALAAAEREWHERFGAELVASWGTMLQFVVERPPRDAEVAWQLAGLLLAVGGSLPMSRYEVALKLPEDDTWFLHDRP